MYNNTSYQLKINFIYFVYLQLLNETFYFITLFGNLKNSDLSCRQKKKIMCPETNCRLNNNNRYDDGG